MTSRGDVAEAFAQGRAAHPRLALAIEDFATYLDARADAWRGALEHAADLYLACACLRGIPHAAEELVTRYLDKLPAYLRRLVPGEDAAAEVRQILAMRILVGDEEHPPALGEYGGRGSLQGWLRIAATRTALNLKRGGARHASWSEAVERRMVQEDGGLAMLKQAYREPFSRALAQAAAALAREHRVLLRLHYVENMTTARLAGLYNVSRPTIVRRLGDAREALLADAQRHLRASLGPGVEDVNEIFALVRSQLDVSLAGMLRQTMSGTA